MASRTLEQTVPAHRPKPRGATPGVLGLDSSRCPTSPGPERRRGRPRHRGTRRRNPDAAGRPLPRPRRCAPPQASRDSVLHIDREAWQVTVDGRRVELTHQEFALLDLLVSTPGRVFSRTELMRLAWRSPAKPHTRTVDVHVSRLRRKLGPPGARLHSVRSVGYTYRPEDPSGASAARGTPGAAPAPRTPGRPGPEHAAGLRR
ncbi:winged helix-turn-helix domain-containing protein [Nocardiopsis composta]